jgi:3-phenylpropionate/trans-cinnamate dioxygenase ferredoxin reductase subunit
MGTVVVGGSLAGLRAAEALRAGGDREPITVVGAEAHRPYDRPPLSKQLLVGRVGVDDLALAVDDALEACWLLGRAAVGLDLDARSVVLDDGTRHGFDRLVIATGSHPRTLPGTDGVGGAHLLRTLEDSLALRAALVELQPSVAIVGAGVIGLEVASSARTLGCEVTVVEAADRPLARLVGPALGPVCAGLHTDAGVDLRLGTGVEGLMSGADGAVRALALSDGSAVDAGVVVVGVGAAPTTGWLEGSGVDLDDGVRCDSRLRVLAGGRPVAGVVAAGDVARWDLPGAGPVRLEHWTNAVESAQAAAATLLGGDAAPEFAPVPYVWSDQHGKKLQLVGWPHPDDDVVLVDGSYEARRFAVALGRRGRLTGGFGMGRPAVVMALRAAIEAGAEFPPAL